MSKKRIRNDKKEEATDDIIRVLFNDGFTSENKMYLYENFSFEHVKNFKTVPEDIRSGCRRFGEELGSTHEASILTLRYELSKEHYTFRTSIYIGDLLGLLKDDIHDYFCIKFAELFPARKINERVQTSVISNAAIRDIVLDLFSVSKSGKRDHKIVKSWKSHNADEYCINNLLGIACILIESFIFRNVRIKYTDEFKFGLFSNKYLRTGQYLCVSPILYTVFSKTFVQIRSEETGETKEQLSVCKRKKLAKRDKEKSEFIVPLKSGRYSGFHHLNNGMGIAGINYFINSSKQPNCVLEHDEIMTGIITKNAKTYSSCEKAVYEISAPFHPPPATILYRILFIPFLNIIRPDF